MRRRWRSADAPPWGDESALAADPVERAKAALLAPHLAGVRSVLDCGCGGGDFLALVDPERRLGPVVGVDVAEQAIVRARRTGRYAELVCADIADAPERVAGRFDLLLLGEVLYYLRDYRGALDRLLELVAPGGVAFLALAVGRDYFGPDDLAAVRAIVAARGLRTEVDRRVDYRWFGLPRRWLRGFGQDSKQVIIASNGR